MVYFANEPAEQPSLRSSRVPRSGFFLFRQMKIVQSFILKLKDHTAKRPYQVAYLSLPNFSTWHSYLLITRSLTLTHTNAISQLNADVQNGASDPLTRLPCCYILPLRPVCVPRLAVLAALPPRLAALSHSVCLHATLSPSTAAAARTAL